MLVCQIYSSSVIQALPEEVLSIAPRRRKCKRAGLSDTAKDDMKTGNGGERSLFPFATGGRKYPG